jgi:hypothetical protein
VVPESLLRSVPLHFGNAESVKDRRSRDTGRCGLTVSPSSLQTVGALADMATGEDGLLSIKPDRITAETA